MLPKHQIATGSFGAFLDHPHLSAADVQRVGMADAIVNHDKNTPVRQEASSAHIKPSLLLRCTQVIKAFLGDDQRHAVVSAPISHVARHEEAVRKLPAARSLNRNGRNVVAVVSGESVTRQSGWQFALAATELDKFSAAQAGHELKCDWTGLFVRPAARRVLMIPRRSLKPDEAKQKPSGALWNHGRRLRACFQIRKLVFASLLAGSFADAATLHYADAAASGAGNGSSWADAWTTASAVESGAPRDSIVYFADGTYSGTITMNTAADGTEVIEWRKATAADHGSETGWSSGMGDGVATFSEFVFGSDYWTLNGNTRDHSDWNDGSSYGFRYTAAQLNTSQTPGVCANTITLQLCDIGGADGVSYTGSEPNFAVYVGGFDELCQNLSVLQCRLHNIAHDAQFHITGLDGGTFRSNYVANGWGKEAVRGQSTFKNVTIAQNFFFNASQNSGEPGEGSTAEIAIWDGGANAFDGNKILGNIFFRNNSEANTGGTIVVGGNGTSWPGSPANDTLILNNTIAGVEGGASGGIILINGGTGNEVRNTLWYDVVGTPSATPNTSNNGEEGSDPFVNYAGGNLRLTAGIAGTSLSSPYNIDHDGATRGADGTFDRGAFEFDDGTEDEEAPSIAITSPTSSATYDNGSSASVNLGVTSSDNIGVTEVRATNVTTGVKLTVTGTTSWSTSSALQSGANTIVAFAYDAAGNSASDSIAVTYTPVAARPAGIRGLRLTR